MALLSFGPLSSAPLSAIPGGVNELTLVITGDDGALSVQVDQPNDAVLGLIGGAGALLVTVRQVVPIVLPICVVLAESAVCVTVTDAGVRVTLADVAVCVVPEST